MGLFFLPLFVWSWFKPTLNDTTFKEYDIALCWDKSCAVPPVPRNCEEHGKKTD